MTSINVGAIGDYMDGIPSTGDLADIAASTPVSGGGINFGNILKHIIFKIFMIWSMKTRSVVTCTII